jgi:putative transposase
MRVLLTRWPVPTPRAWIERVNQPETEAELEALWRSVARSQPFGSAAWQEQTAERLGLQSTFRAPGRPGKQTRKARE